MAKLVDRLAAVDLLDQAAVLLERQLGHLSAGEDRARIATQLAELRLNNQKPQAALDALEASAAPDLSSELRLRRTLLHARTLAALGRTEAAVAMLHDDHGIDAIRLRADIIWRSGQWAAAAQAYRSVLALIKPVGGKLDDADAEAVLKGAIALAFTQDTGALDQLRAQYGASMAEGPHGHAFEVVTSRPSKAKLRAVLGELGDVRAFKGLLAAGNTPPRQGKTGP
jgi:outer membrane PBP1 activator LpoA protein